MTWQELVDFQLKQSIGYLWRRKSWPSNRKIGSDKMRDYRNPDINSIPLIWGAGHEYFALKPQDFLADDWEKNPSCPCCGKEL